MSVESVKQDTEGNGIPSYTLFPPEEHRPKFSTEVASEAAFLGEIREPEIFETEHHVYTVPFRYRNVKVENFLTRGGGKGIELAAEIGTITIEEEKPIISVTVVGSGCSGRNYNIVEWWGPGENIRNLRKLQKLVKRQRADNMNGQHNAWIQTALTEEPPEFETAREARDYIKQIQRIFYNMTSGYSVPGSVMSGLYENTAYFRIGDTSRPENTVHKVVIRGGGLDYEDPGGKVARYPADYTFRLIDLVVRK